MDLPRLLARVDRRKLRIEWRRRGDDEVECFVRGRKRPVGFGCTWTSALADLLRRL